MGKCTSYRLEFKSTLPTLKVDMVTHDCNPRIEGDED